MEAVCSTPPIIATICRTPARSPARPVAGCRFLGAVPSAPHRPNSRPYSGRQIGVDTGRRRRNRQFCRRVPRPGTTGSHPVPGAAWPSSPQCEVAQFRTKLSLPGLLSRKSREPLRGRPRAQIGSNLLACLGVGSKKVGSLQTTTMQKIGRRNAGLSLPLLLNRWSPHPSNGAMTKLTIAMTLIRMFIDGPEVSLNGSPTVSPTTVAL